MLLPPLNKSASCGRAPPFRDRTPPQPATPIQTRYSPRHHRSLSRHLPSRGQGGEPAPLALEYAFAPNLSDALKLLQEVVTESARRPRRSDVRLRPGYRHLPTAAESTAARSEARKRRAPLSYERTGKPPAHLPVRWPNFLARGHRKPDGLHADLSRSCLGPSPCACRALIAAGGPLADGPAAAHRRGVPDSPARQLPSRPGGGSRTAPSGTPISTTATSVTSTPVRQDRGLSDPDARVGPARTHRRAGRIRVVHRPGAGVIGRVDPRTGEIKEFPLPASARNPHTPICHQGKVWFTDANNNSYGGSIR